MRISQNSKAKIMKTMSNTRNIRRGSIMKRLNLPFLLSIPSFPNT